MSLWKSFRDLGLGLKLTIVLTIGMVVLLVAVTAAVLINAQNLTAQAGRGRARQEAEVIQSRFRESRQDVLATAEFLLRRVALEKAVAQGQTPADIRSMMVVGKLAIDLDNVAIVDPNGVYVTGIQSVEGNIITSPQRDALLALALTGTGTKATAVILETDRYNLWLAAVIPLYGTKHEITGALLAARQVDDELLQELNFSRDDVHLALVANGQILAQDFPNPELVGEFSTALTEEPYEPGLGEETVVADDLLRSAEGTPYALAHSPLTEAGASAVIMVDMGELYNFQRQLMVTTAIVLSSLALVSVLGVVIFARTSIAVPLGRLRSVAERMASGDYQQLAEVKTADEVGQLAGAFNDMTIQLRQTLESLERRTADLQHRSIQLQASAEVARGAVSILEVDQLIRQAVDLICERFNLYYVGLFLLDAERRFAVLRAGTGEAGQEMLARGHRLEVGGDSMIGQCTAKAEAAIALDVGEEAVHFDNPLLPETRSEMALPLRSRGRVIGAMSVQSAEAAAFDDEDVSVMQTMADQVAAAIDNARLFAESQAALEAERRAYGEFSERAWRELLRARTDWGYHYTRQAVTPVEGDWRPEMRRAERIGRSVQGNPERAEGGGGTNGAALAVPIQVRGETVGVIGFRKGAGGETWTAEEVVLLETLVNQLGEALESTRLYRDTQRRAARERLTAEIAGRVRETLDIDMVLQTAVREISEALGTTEVEVRMSGGVKTKR